MAEDNRNFIEQTQSKAVLYHGHELSPQEMATEFAKFGIDDRADALDRLNSETGELSVQEATRRVAYESALRNTHETLRKVGR